MPHQLTFPPDDSMRPDDGSNNYWNRYLPAPRNGKRCPVSGFSHSTFYRVVINGPARKHVRIADLRRPGQRRSTKYYHAGDLLHWIDDNSSGGNPSNGN